MARSRQNQKGVVLVIELLILAIVIITAAVVGLKFLARPKTTSSPPVPPVHTPIYTNDDTPITYADNGKTIKLDKNQSLTIQLDSTYWQIHEASDTNVIRLSGEPIVKGIVSGPGCFPGEGCGTVTAKFTPHAPGTATISASRTTCGEAMYCTGDKGKFQITVITPALK